jgi:Cu(I)/Ag(I) efflux system membrane fusion protein
MKDAYLYKTFLTLAVVLVLGACKGGEKDEAAAHEHRAPEVYTCPMHPEVIRSAPGSCPICGMDLVKKETGSKAVTEVALETLLRPANAYVVSSVPVTALEDRLEEAALNVVGTIAYDTRQAGAISSRVGGRIERLYVRYRYQPVKKGQRIMDIYSPELVTAQQNLIFLLQNDAGNTSLIEAAKDRLLLMGMTSSQVATVMRNRKLQYAVPVYSSYSGFVTELGAATAGTTAPGGGMGASGGGMQPTPEAGAPAETALQIREGSYVQSGQAVLAVNNADKAWVMLDVFPEQQALAQVGSPVRIVPETAPQQNFRGRIGYLEPIFRPGTKTLAARVYFNNAAMKLPVGSRVTATIFAPSKKAHWLPKEALLSLGRDRIVFLREGAGFRARKVLTGMELNQYVQVTGGLQPTDSVAANAQYLVDNEAFIKVQEP